MGLHKQTVHGLTSLHLCVRLCDDSEISRNSSLVSYFPPVFLLVSLFLMLVSNCVGISEIFF